MCGLLSLPKSATLVLRLFHVSAGTPCLAPAYRRTGCRPTVAVVRSVACLTAAVLVAIGLGVSAEVGLNDGGGLAPAIPSSWVASTFRGPGLEVVMRHPASWRVPPQPVFGADMGALANFPVHPVCEANVCRFARLGSFPPNGVFVDLDAWQSGAGFSENVMLGEGPRLTIDGKDASETGIYVCAGTGAERSVDYTVIDGQIQGVLDLQFCLRGPAFSLLSQQLADVLASLRIVLDPTTAPTVTSGGPPVVHGGTVVDAATVPVCGATEIDVGLLISKRAAPGATTLVFTTTIRANSRTACGMPALQTCATYGVVTVRTSSGKAVWEWAPMQLESPCDTSELLELPMSVTSQPMIVPAGALAAGHYLATTQVLSRSQTAGVNLP